MSERKKSLPPKATFIQHTVASQLGGATSTILLYPIDVVRMRFMSQDDTRIRQHNGQTYHSITTAFRLIYREEGGTRAFFRGCHVSVLGTVCAWGVYMYFYRCQCAWYETWQNNQQQQQQRPTGTSSQEETSKGTISVGSGSASWKSLVQRFGFSIVASCTSAVVCNPIWLLKTRMQLEEASARTETVQRNFRTFRHGFVYTVKTTGLRSLWRGVSAQMLLAIPNAFNLPLYDTIKSTTMSLTGRNELSVVEVCTCSTLTKVVLALICQPLLVVKTRLQDHRARSGEVQYETFAQSTKTVWRRGGLVAFYRGMVPSLCQAVPRSVLTFVFYEKFLRFARQIS
ncbi:putative mitochondrial mitochondrial carrier protein-like protein [Leptomonas pyrrhocoris]|uniref:Putative mitochondrial mitochondrial carrier protein-like protein n=1 Tax=Leptomonas pyrrhocoris TaxID=157538 RepID=A0A0M9G880_LEPPY|nr:putative mitochondrial mitochondrial carrier protein-like protein [Leptomonas pyrrhocoris]XP_015663077.1 putative mitochondrial mitochondrial carrier protein-like protein [Leptomonas pyrrhocoris]KPA84637.1 putative mitochondrial mitochondrial carrier protein-like protein [Leptomonas pyrrhocoris]KPA84638.1 putative mitochondrial mitochondrial carrier protein-like protein [Leptomonas pyrrhocoris]|eukprot:XP_015663076.1 putative mitochondrial mitochondrial carrier protein-like protein [Leptomonas pyrrhocoris]